MQQFLCTIFSSSERFFLPESDGNKVNDASNLGMMMVINALINYDLSSNLAFDVFRNNAVGWVGGSELDK